MEKRRVRRACARCRRQKLKCDNTRPCCMCQRSGLQCQEAIRKPMNKDSSREQQNLPAAPPDSFQAFSPPSREVSDQVQPHNLSHTHLVPPTQSEAASSPQPQSGLELSHRGISNPGSVHSNIQESSHRHHHQPEELPKRQERLSTFSLIESLFQSYSSRLGRSDAIPGGRQAESTDRNDLVPVEALIGISLPPTEVVNALFSTYLTSCHWYITLFHEPTFRAEIDPILETRQAHTDQKSLLLFLLVILLHSSRYCSDSEFHDRFPLFDLVAAKVEWLKASEHNCLSGIEKINVAHLGYLFLLSTIYLNSQKPALAFSLAGMAIRGAQTIGLHKEASWGSIDPIDRNVRRLVWWSLYMTDQFLAQIFGIPSALNDSDIQVQKPIDIDETAPTCPGFGTLERRENGSMQPVTTLSYNRYKTDLYLISAPLTRNMYFQPHFQVDSIIQQVRDVHIRLREWERTIPPELKPSSFVNLSSSALDPVVRTFALQALTLQATYDNIQLLLFRPFLGHKQSARSLDPQVDQISPSPSSPGSRLSESRRSMIITSRDQCWVSAMRLSKADHFIYIVRLMEQTTPFTQWITYSLSAAVMLTVLALSNLFSTRTQECKFALARLIRMLQNAKVKTALCEQVIGMITDLMRLVADQEIQAMISIGNQNVTKEGTEVPFFGSPESIYIKPSYLSYSSDHQTHSDSSQIQAETVPGLLSHSTSRNYPIAQSEDESPSANISSSRISAPMFQPEDPSASQIGLAAANGDVYTSGGLDISALDPHTDWLQGCNLDGLGQTWMWNNSFNLI